LSEGVETVKLQFRNLISVIVLFVFLVPLAGCDQRQPGNAQSEDVFFRAKRSGTLKVGYVVLAPWVLKEPGSGQLSGAYIDLINEIARQSNLKLEFTETTWATFAASLASGTFDISIVPSYITIQRANAIAFTRPISYLGNTAIVRANETRFKSVYDLNQPGIKVSVLQGEQGDDFARATLGKASISAISGGNQSLVYTEVSTGKSDAALGDLGSIPAFITNNPGVKDISPGSPYSVLPVSWATRYQDQAMRTFLNSCIEYLHGSGIMEAVHKKWNVSGTTRPQ
jgi:polar amino acid transport system substrate-binding protein